MCKTIAELQIEIEDFIDAYDGTAIGRDIRNRYANSNGSEDSLLNIMEYIDTMR